MTKSPQNNVTKAPKKPRAKPPLEINLVGPVGELVAAEFARLREQNDRLEKKLESFEKKLDLIVEQTRYPFKIYDVKDFENIFEVKPRTQLNYRTQGKLNYFKRGVKVFYTQHHLEEYMARTDSQNIRND